MSLYKDEDQHTEAYESGDGFFDGTRYTVRELNDEEAAMIEAALNAEAERKFDEAERRHDEGMAWAADDDVDDTDNEEDGTMQSYIGTWWKPVHKLAWRPTIAPLCQSEAKAEPRSIQPKSFVAEYDARDARYTSLMSEKYAYRYTRRKSAPVNSPQRELEGPKLAPAARWTPKLMQTDGWTAGEREAHAAQKDSGICITPDTNSEAEREAARELDMIDYREFKIKETFRHKVALTWMAVADGETNPKTKKPWTNREAGKRVWGLEQAEARILAELESERAAVEVRDLSDIEILESQEATDNDEREARRMIAESPRKHLPLLSSTEEEDDRHQRECEAETMRAEAKDNWIKERTAENKTLLQTALARYFTEFGATKKPEWTMETPFPMWTQDATSKKWKLTPVSLGTVYTDELAKRGEAYKALWTMAKMVDTRYEAQLQYKRSQRKATHNTKVAAAKEAAAQSSDLNDSGYLAYLDSIAS